MKTLVSIITPAYNVGRFFPETAKSVKNQTLDFSLFEWIIVNDGSTDNTLEIIKKETRNMKNIRILSGENTGTASARNEGIRNSIGKFIVLLDGDDILEKSSLESSYAFMMRNPNLYFLYSRHKRIDEKGNFLCNRNGYPFFRERLLHFNFIGPLKCFRREVFDKLEGFDISSYAEDYDFVLRASEILNSEQIKQNSEYLYRYRIYSQNKSVSGKEKSREGAIKSIRNSLKRKERIEANVYFSHVTPDFYTYFDWEKK